MGNFLATEAPPLRLTLMARAVRTYAEQMGDGTGVDQVHALADIIGRTAGRTWPRQAASEPMTPTHLPPMNTP